MDINPLHLIELHSKMTADPDLLGLLVDVVGSDLDLAATATAAVAGRKDQVLKDLEVIDSALELYCSECGGGIWRPGVDPVGWPEPEITSKVLDPYHRAGQFWDDILDKWAALQYAFIDCVDGVVMSEK